MSAGRGAAETVRSRRPWLIPILLLDLAVLFWLGRPIDPSQQLSDQTQALLDDALGPRKARCHIYLDEQQRIHGTIAVAGVEATTVEKLVSQALGLQPESGDSLAVVAASPPPEGLRIPNPTVPLAALMAVALAVCGLGQLAVQVPRRCRAAMMRWRDWREARAARRASLPTPPPAVESPVVSLPDDLRLELSSNLLYLVNPRKGAPLSARVEELRRRYVEELGTPAPAVTYARHQQLPARHWRLSVRGRSVAEGALPRGTTEPLETLLWAEMRSRAGDFLGVDEVEQLLKECAISQPALVREVRRCLSAAELTRRLRGELAESGSLRNLDLVLERLALQS